MREGDMVRLPRSQTNLDIFLPVLGDGAFGAQLFETDPTGVVCGNSLFFSPFLRGGAEGALLFETDH